MRGRDVDHTDGGEEAKNDASGDASGAFHRKSPIALNSSEGQCHTPGGGGIA